MMNTMALVLGLVSVIALRPGTETSVALTSPADDGKTVRVTFPKGVVTNNADIVVRNAAKATVELDGRGTSYAMPRPSAGGAWGPAFEFSGGTKADGRMWNFDYNGAAARVDPGVLTDFLVRFSCDGKSRTLAFESGRLAFGSTSYLKIFQGDAGSEPLDSVLEIGPRAELSTEAGVALSHPSPKNMIRVRGGTLRMPGSVFSFGPYWGTRAKTDVPRTVSIQVSDGGLFSFGGRAGHAMALGSEKCGSTSNVTFALLADAARIEQSAPGYAVRTDGPGRHVLGFRNGSTASFACPVSLGGKAGATGELTVDGSTASFTGPLTLGAGGRRAS